MQTNKHLITMCSHSSHSTETVQSAALTVICTPHWCGHLEIKFYVVIQRCEYILIAVLH